MNQKEMPEIENSGTEIKNTIDMLNNVEVMRENVTRDRSEELEILLYDTCTTR